MGGGKKKKKKRPTHIDTMKLLSPFVVALAAAFGKFLAGVEWCNGQIFC